MFGSDCKNRQFGQKLPRFKIHTLRYGMKGRPKGGRRMQMLDMSAKDGYMALK